MCIGSNRFYLNARVVFKPSNGAGPCGVHAYGRVVGKLSDREILIIWDNTPNRIERAPSWNGRLQVVSEVEYQKIKACGY